MEGSPDKRCVVLLVSKSVSVEMHRGDWGHWNSAAIFSQTGFASFLARLPLPVLK
jgi:hypothetical protein